MAARHSRRWWFARVAELPGSGLKHREFAATLSVSLAALRHWIYVERRERRRALVPALVEVQWPPACVEPLETAFGHRKGVVGEFNFFGIGIIFVEREVSDPAKAKNVALQQV